MTAAKRTPPSGTCGLSKKEFLMWIACLVAYEHDYDSVEGWEEGPDREMVLKDMTHDDLITLLKDIRFVVEDRKWCLNVKFDYGYSMVMKSFDPETGKVRFSTWKPSDSLEDQEPPNEQNPEEYLELLDRLM